MAKSELTWSDVQIKRLKEIYSSASWADMEKEFGKSCGAIQRKINVLGLKRANLGWSDSEVELLRQKFSELSQKELEILFNKSYQAIYQKARSIGLDSSFLWSEEEEQIVKDQYGKIDIRELSDLLGRSERAILHKANELKVTKSVVWSADELDLLRQNQGLSSKQLQDLGLQRSAVAIANARRGEFGTSQRLLRDNASIPSKELAYILGVICSDASVISSGAIMSVKASDAEFADEFARCMQLVFGLVPNKSIHRGSWMYKGEKLFSDYYSVGIFSVKLLSFFAIRSGIECGNVRGPDNEWVDFLDEKFSWVWGEDFFWYFMGGLYDGDGNLGIYSVNLAIVPVRSKQRISDELLKRGLKPTFDKFSIHFNGKDQQDEFLSVVKNILKRKQSILVEAEVQDQVIKLDHSTATKFFNEYHYLKSFPGNCIAYGYIEKNKVIGVCAISNVSLDSSGLNHVELQRFALIDWTEVPASKILAAFLSTVKKEYVVDYIQTFADQNQNHVGIIYQATNALYLGQSGPQQVFVALTGKRYSGRFSDKKMLKDGVDRSICTIEYVPGKHKYVYIVSDKAGVFLNKFSLAFPKKA